MVMVEVAAPFATTVPVPVRVEVAAEIGPAVKITGAVPARVIGDASVKVLLSA
jgi:hypothetical protein